LWPSPYAGAQPVINELYYDHPGSDDGYEFVEIFNTTTAALSLAGVTLEFHNGVGEGWDVLWTGTAADVVPAGGVFVVGGALVEPPVSVVVLLRMQNGPDAIRLAQGGSTVDLVGYGNLDDPGFVERKSAPGAPAGYSLGRVPDGRDTQDNASDFSQMVPSPGRLNVPRNDVAVYPHNTTPVGGAVGEDGHAPIELVLFNNGLNAVPEHSLAVEVWDSTDGSAYLYSSLTNDAAIESNAEEIISAPVWLSGGYHWLVIRVSYPPDERNYDNELTLLRRVGGPRIMVSEILSYPPGGCPQFVELYNAGAVPETIRGFKLKDRVSAPAAVTSDSVFIPPRGFVVLTPDKESLLRFFPGAPANALVQHESSWPAFNRSGSGEVSDSVVFMDSYALTVDAVGYPPLGSDDRGRSLERIDLYGGSAPPTWVLSSDPSRASPGRPNSRSLYELPSVSLAARPNPFSPYDGETLSIVVNPSRSGVRAVACVYGADGRKIADLGSATAYPAVFIWDGTDGRGGLLVPGLYIVTCEFFSADGNRIFTDKVVVGCGRKCG